jgi:hypothetical protein
LNTLQTCGRRGCSNPMHLRELAVAGDYMHQADVDTDVCRYINITAFAHSVLLSPSSPSIRTSNYPPKRNDRTGRDERWGGLLLYCTVMASSGLPGRISKRSRSPENVPCLVAGAKRKILDLIIEWHSPFGRRALACFV